MKKILLVIVSVLSLLVSFGQTGINGNGSKKDWFWADSDYVLKGVAINIFDDDTTMAGNSAHALPTQHALVTYILHHTGNTDSTVFYTDFRADTSRKNIYSALSGKQPVGVYLIPADSVNFRTNSNNLYQLKGAYILPSDTATFRAYSNALYQAKGGYITPTDTINQRNYSNALYKTIASYIVDTTNGRTYSNALYQPILGYTPEDQANKATDLSTNDNTHYPTTAATQAAIDGVTFWYQDGFGINCNPNTIGVGKTPPNPVFGTYADIQGALHADSIKQGVINAMIKASADGRLVAADSTKDYATSKALKDTAANNRAAAGTDTAIVAGVGLTQSVSGKKKTLNVDTPGVIASKQRLTADSSIIMGAVNGKQTALGFTPENVTNKVSAQSTSTISYPNWLGVTNWATFQNATLGGNDTTSNNIVHTDGNGNALVTISHNFGQGNIEIDGLGNRAFYNEDAFEFIPLGSLATIVGTKFIGHRLNNISTPVDSDGILVTRINHQLPDSTGNFNISGGGGSGTVTTVSANGPLSVANPTTTPAISIDSFNRSTGYTPQGNRIRDSALAATNSATNAANIATNTSNISSNTAAILLRQYSLVPTGVKTSNYSAVVNDFVPVNNSAGNVTITLPTTPADKTTIGIETVNTATNDTTKILTGGTDVFYISGGTTQLNLITKFQGKVFQYSSSTGIWYVLADNLSLSQLDLRYYPLTGNPSSFVDTSVTNNSRHRLGQIFNVNFNANSGSAYEVINPNTTFTFTSGGLTTSGGNNTPTNYVAYNTYNTSASKWTRSITFTPNTDGNGIGLGVTAASQEANIGHIVLTGSKKAELIFDTYKGGVVTTRIIDSTNLFAYTNNSSQIQLSITRDFMNYIFSAHVVGTSLYETVTWTDSLIFNNIPSAFPNDTAAIYHYGGTQTVTNDNFSIDEMVQPELGIWGNSLTFGTYSGGSENPYPWILKKLINGGVAICGGHGSQTSDFIAYQNEFFKLRPKYALFNDGLNNITNNTAVSSTKSDIQAFVNNCEVNGIVPMVSEIAPVGSGVTGTGLTNTQVRNNIISLNGFIDSLGVIVIPVYNSFVSAGLLNANYDCGDGKHWTQWGQQVYANLVMQTLNGAIAITQAPIGNYNVNGRNFSISGNVNSNFSFNVSNNSSGTSATAQFSLSDPAGTSALSKYNPGGLYSNTTALSDPNGGLTFTATGTTGELYFVTGANSFASGRGSVSTTGLWKFGDTASSASPAVVNIIAGTTATAPLRFNLAGAALRTAKQRGDFEPVSNDINYTDSTNSTYKLAMFSGIGSNGGLPIYNTTTGHFSVNNLIVQGATQKTGAGTDTIVVNSPIIVASADSTGKTTANNIVTYTTGAADSTFNISANINVTGGAGDVIQTQVVYTDETNTSRTIVLFNMGATSAGIGSATTGPSSYPVLGDVRVKASTTITVQTALTTGIGTITYNEHATITKIR